MLGRKDFDKKGEPCVSYDVVANPEAHNEETDLIWDLLSAINLSFGNGTTYGKIVVILGMVDGIGPQYTVLWLLIFLFRFLPETATFMALAASLYSLDSTCKFCIFWRQLDLISMI